MKTSQQWPFVYIQIYGETDAGDFLNKAQVYNAQNTRISAENIAWPDTSFFNQVAANILS